MANTMYEILSTLAGAPTNGYEEFVFRLASVILSVLFVYMVPYMIQVIVSLGGGRR